MRLDRDAMMRNCPDCGTEYPYGPRRCNPCNIKHRRTLQRAAQRAARLRRKPAGDA